MLAAQRWWEEGRITKARRDDIHTATGINNSQHGLLADMQLRWLMPILNVVVIDWLHTLFQEGALSVEMFLMYNTLAAILPGGSGAAAERLCEFLRTWQFPQHSTCKGRDLHRLFDKYRLEKCRHTVPSWDRRASSSGCTL